MGIACKCDKCGKYFEWYEACYYNKQFNHMNCREMEQWEEENPYAKYWESNKPWFNANCIQLKLFEPINTNMASNNGVLSGEVEDPENGNNELIILCADCLSDFLTSLQRFWDLI